MSACSICSICPIPSVTAAVSSCKKMNLMRMYTCFFLDWERITLLPCVLLGGSDLEAVTARLVAVQLRPGARFLHGASLSSADVAVYSTLLPVLVRQRHERRKLLEPRVVALPGGGGGATGGPAHAHPRAAQHPHHQRASVRQQRTAPWQHHWLRAERRLLHAVLRVQDSPQVRLRGRAG